MGKLLSRSIKMQNGAATTATLQYLVAGYVQGTISMYKNGSLVEAMTADKALTSVTINAGDTMYMQLTGGNSIVTTFIYYSVNGTLTGTFSGNTTITTSTYTASAGNTYKFDYQGAA